MYCESSTRQKGDVKMGTRAFVSWSGGLREQTARNGSGLAVAALKSIGPHFAHADVEKSAEWGNEVSDESAASRRLLFGITSSLSVALRFVCHR